MTESLVALTGVGVVSPLGCSLAELTRRFAAGETAIRPVADAGCEAAVAALVPDIPLERVPAATLRRVGRMDRVTRLFLGASCLAVEAAGLDLGREDPERIGLVFGTGLGCLLTNSAYFEKIVESGGAAASPQLFAYTVSSAAAGEVSIALGIRGPNVTLHAGFAAGLQAVGYAADLIRLGRADLVLAGGGDAVGPALLEGLDAMRLLKRTAPRPFADATPGIVPGEAGVILVLESAAHADGRGVRPLAHLAGYAAGFEPTLTRRDRDTAGIETVLTRALAAAGWPVADVGVVMSSAHGTPLDAVEAAALRGPYTGAPAPLLFAPKGALGDCFGASGPLALVLAAGLVTSPAPPVAPGLAFELGPFELGPASDAASRLGRAPAALVHSLCYSGTSVAMVLATPE